MSPRPQTPRPRRGLRPEPEALEGRTSLTVTGLTLLASPRVLTPISPRNQPSAVTARHQLPVTLAGEVVGTRADVRLTYRVFDEYDQYTPTGPVPLQLVQVVTPPGGPPLCRSLFTTRIGLSDVRKPPGRTYIIQVTATDADGSKQALAVVSVPPVGFFHPLQRLVDTRSRGRG